MLFTSRYFPGRNRNSCNTGFSGNDHIVGQCARLMRDNCTTNANHESLLLSLGSKLSLSPESVSLTASIVTDGKPHQSCAPVPNPHSKVPSIYEVGKGDPLKSPDDCNAQSKKLADTSHTLCGDVVFKAQQNKQGTSPVESPEAPQNKQGASPVSSPRLDVQAMAPATLEMAPATLEAAQEERIRNALPKIEEWCKAALTQCEKQKIPTDKGRSHIQAAITRTTARQQDCNNATFIRLARRLDALEAIKTKIDSDQLAVIKVLGWATDDACPAYGSEYEAVVCRDLKTNQTHLIGLHGTLSRSNEANEAVVISQAPSYARLPNDPLQKKEILQLAQKQILQKDDPSAHDTHTPKPNPTHQPLAMPPIQSGLPTANPSDTPKHRPMASPRDTHTPNPTLQPLAMPPFQSGSPTENPSDAPEHHPMASPRDTHTSKPNPTLQLLAMPPFQSGSPNANPSDDTSEERFWECIGRLLGSIPSQG